MMHLAVYFWTGQKNFDAVREYLTRVHRLVAPIGYDGQVHADDVPTYLIYEDARLILGNRKGVYRVHFKSEHEEGPHIGFRYYENRLTSEIMLANPMRPAVMGVHELLRPVLITDDVIEEIAPDAL